MKKQCENGKRAIDDKKPGMVAQFIKEAAEDIAEGKDCYSFEEFKETKISDLFMQLAKLENKPYPVNGFEQIRKTAIDLFNSVPDSPEDQTKFTSEYIQKYANESGKIDLIISELESAPLSRFFSVSQSQ